MYLVKFLNDVRNEFGLFARGDTCHARLVEQNGSVKLDHKPVPAMGISMLIAGASGDSEADYVYFRVPKAWIEIVHNL